MGIDGDGEGDVLRTGIPRGHPHKDAIETAILEELARNSSGWQAALELAPDGEHLVLMVRREADGNETVIFIPLGEEATAAVRQAIRLTVERASQDYSTESRPKATEVM